MAPTDPSYELAEGSTWRAQTRRMTRQELDDQVAVDVRLHNRTLLKLDCLLLPFLALLFLFNALDKANVSMPQDNQPTVTVRDASLRH